MKAFGLSYEDAYDTNDHRMRIKWQPANPGLQTWKMVVKGGVCVSPGF